MNFIILLTFLINILQNNSSIFLDRKLSSEIKLKENLKISEFLQNFLNTNDYTDNRIVLDNRVAQYEFKQDINTNTPIKIKFPRTVGSYLESLEFFLDSIEKDNKTLQIKKDYGFNLTYGEDLITTYQKPLIFYEKENNTKYNIEFNLNQPELKTNFKHFYIEELNEIISINNLILGIDKNENKLKIFELKNEIINEIKEIEILFEVNKNSTLKFNYNKIKNIVQDSNGKKENRYIMFIDIENNVNIFKVKEVNSLMENELPKIYFSCISQYKDKRSENENIIDFIEKKEILYIAYNSYIIMRNYQIELKEISSQNLQILDLHKVNNAIYVILKNFGMKILDISLSSQPEWTNFNFNHPNLIKISSYNNPYTDFPFLGIIVKNLDTNLMNEFYIELSLKDEFNPLVNKYFLTDKFYDIKYITNDEEFVYLFEHNSNSLLIFSRSSTSTSRNSVYKIHIKDLNTLDVLFSPFIITDESYLHNHFGIISDNKFIITDKVEFMNANIEIKFNKPGEYKMEFHTFSDFCNLSKDQVKMCKVYLDYKFIVKEESLLFYDSILMKIVLLIIALLLIVLILFVLFKFNNWIRNKNYIQYYQNEQEDSNNNYEMKKTEQEVVIGQSK